MLALLLIMNYWREFRFREDINIIAINVKKHYHKVIEKHLNLDCDDLTFADNFLDISFPVN